MKKYIVKILNKIKLIVSKKRREKFNYELSLDKINEQFIDRTSQYKYFHHYFWNLSPDWLKEHRDYFSKEKRGFGEDAFHSMWYLLLKEFKPKNILEIGVYRGQTLSLFSLLSKKFSFKAEIHGISPFTSAGDEVSEYLDSLNYYNDVKNNFNYLGLPLPILHRGFSTDKEMIKVMQTKQWDLIYIDGNHDYEVVKHDFDICSKQLREGGLIVLDDASLNTNYKPQINSTAGHPGPSKLASEIDMNYFEEILSVGHNRVFKKL
jgi:predicted O-methyltransferase YrrM